jgi:hypothetical protein
MNRPALVISLLAVFLVGASLGLMAGIAFEHHPTFGPHPGPMGPRAGMRGGRPPLSEVLPRLARALDLTPGQVERIRPKVVASQQQFEAARESLRSRIETELTPQQIARWHEIEHQRPFPGFTRGPQDRFGRAPARPEGESR